MDLDLHAQVLEDAASRKGLHASYLWQYLSRNICTFRLYDRTKATPLFKFAM